MKKIAFCMLFTACTIIVFAQKSLSKAAIKNFAEVCSYNLKNDNNSFLTAALVNGLATNYGIEKTYRIMGSAETDVKSREILFSAFHELGNSEKLTFYLRDWGLNPVFAKEIAYYIDQKYSRQELFTGQKTFTDGDGWKYVVTINKNKIVLKSYPTENNEFYKDKNKPQQVYSGTIDNGKITVSGSTFKYENGILYELNNEGGWNAYPELR